MSNYDFQTFKLNTLGFSSGTKKSVSFNLLYNTFFQKKFLKMKQKIY